MKEHTNNFFNKEIEFFENYSNNDLTDQSFFDELLWLRDENMKTGNSFLLRIGANEGWHSITGDWRWRNHIKATEDNRGNYAGKMQKAYKTRKIIFSKQKSDNNLYFSLPGFVKITLSND